MNYALGLEPVLTASDYPRDDILAHLVNAIADETLDDRYELRELLSSDLPMSSDDGSQKGELLVMMRADNVGSPLRRAEADRVIALVDAIGRTGTFEGTLAISGPGSRSDGGQRIVIVPPFCINGPVNLGSHHPLHGVMKLSAVFAKEHLAADEPVQRLLDLCISEKLPISCW